MCPPGRADEPLSPSDLSVLCDLARQVGIALYAARLTDDLQRARERLVIAREAERRRIRNDLHDGLAPTLSSLAAPARRGAQPDPPGPRAGRSACSTTGVMTYAAPPPKSVNWSMTCARRCWMNWAWSGQSRASSFPARSSVLRSDAPEPMPELPAAMEVAAYRIASEVLHNVVKHAQATECVVNIEIGDGRLTLSFADNGKGMRAGLYCRRRPGVDARARRRAGRYARRHVPARMAALVSSPRYQYV